MTTHRTRWSQVARLAMIPLLIPVLGVACIGWALVQISAQRSVGMARGGEKVA